MIRHDQIKELFYLYQMRENAPSAKERKALSSLIEDCFAKLGFSLDVVRIGSPQMRLPMNDVDGAPPWHWVVQEFFSAMLAGQRVCPYRYDTEDGAAVLCVRVSDLLDCVRSRAKEHGYWLSPLRSPRVLKKALLADGVLMTMPDGRPMDVERTINGARVAHQVLLRLDVLARFGIRLGLGR